MAQGEGAEMNDSKQMDITFKTSDESVTSDVKKFAQSHRTKPGNAKRGLA